MLTCFQSYVKNFGGDTKDKLVLIEYEPTDSEMKVKFPAMLYCDLRGSCPAQYAREAVERLFGKDNVFPISNLSCGVTFMIRDFTIPPLRNVRRLLKIRYNQIMKKVEELSLAAHPITLDSYV